MTFSSHAIALKKPQISERVNHLATLPRLEHEIKKFLQQQQMESAADVKLAENCFLSFFSWIFFEQNKQSKKNRNCEAIKESIAVIGFEFLVDNRINQFSQKKFKKVQSNQA